MGYLSTIAFRFPPPFPSQPPPNSDWDFPIEKYQVSAGIGFLIDKSVSLDVGARYSNHEVETSYTNTNVSLKENIDDYETLVSLGYRF